MAFTLSGQKPAVLDPVHTIPIKGDYDPLTAMKKVLIEPLFEPMRPGGTVTLVDDKNNVYDEDATLDKVIRCLGDSVKTNREAEVKDLYQQGLVHYDQTSPLLVNELFTVQDAHANKLPHPGPRVLYTASHDVIPAAKGMLAGSNDESLFFASIAYTYSPEALGFWFKSTQAYEDFTDWLTQQITLLTAIVPGNTTNLLSKLAQTKLKLVEGYNLRSDDGDQNEEYSFARTIVHLLMQYSQQQVANGTNEMGVMPFSVGELFAPKTIIFANVEAHARATPKKVDSEWRLVNASLASPVRVISNKSLANLTSMPRAMAKAAAAAANAASNKHAQVTRSAKVVFRKQPPNRIDIEKGVLRVLRRMKEVNKSQNVMKKVKTTFSKANRRDPQNYNKPGKSVSTHYLPDLHIYIDTSGSISEYNYQQSVLMMIKLAKKLNVNLYFNSFSHVLSQEVMLKTKDKSIQQIWNEFTKVPKVDGGTNFRQIWQYINASAKRRARLSLMITDFEWSPGTQREPHPVNLYYAPCGNMDWDRMVYYAEAYVKSMRHNDPAIAQHLIGIVA